MPFTDAVPTMRGPASTLATEKQVAFLTKLLATKQHDHDMGDMSTLTRAEASRYIEALIAAPWKPKTEQTPSSRSRSLA
jgi:hypothetical protein